MKKIPLYAWILIAYVIAICAYVSFACALERDIHVEWGYTPPSSPEVTGFILYQEGLKSCTFEGADTKEGDCSVNITDIQTAFTLTAIFNDNTESPKSAPFVFVHDILAPTIINITIN